MGKAVSTRPFDRAMFSSFRFVGRSLSDNGVARLEYALDDQIHFVEEFSLPGAPLRELIESPRVQNLLSLLHWVAGVSYFKTAVPDRVSMESGAPSPAVIRLLDGLYSEGLGEFAFVNGLKGLPRPEFPAGPSPLVTRNTGSADPRVLVPVGGGKDSVVALEIVRRLGVPMCLFSIGNAPPIERTVQVSGLDRLLVSRRIDPGLAELNERGALNGHVPVTAIVSCVALLTAALNGFETVVLANERSASIGNVEWDGVTVNHQYSKGAEVETLMREALAEVAPGLSYFSILRPASELAIARAFAQLPQYHRAFTSCNAIFRLDPTLKASSWCTDCPKCRFVFLILAPFLAPAKLSSIFGRDMLDDDSQFEGFALLTSTGGHKPFECVGEEEESLAAIRLLANDKRWSGHSVVRRLIDEVLPGAAPGSGDAASVLALSPNHNVPEGMMRELRAVLGA